MHLSRLQIERPQAHTILSELGLDPTEMDNPTTMEEDVAPAVRPASRARGNLRNCSLITEPLHAPIVHGPDGRNPGDYPEGWSNQPCFRTALTKRFRV